MTSATIVRTAPSGADEVREEADLSVMVPAGSAEGVGMDTNVYVFMACANTSFTEPYFTEPI